DRNFLFRHKEGVDIGKRPSVESKAMVLFDPLFGSGPVCGALTDSATVQAMLDFEAALARAEAKVGVIPSDAVDAIASQCRSELYDFSEISLAANSAGNLAIPLVKALTQQVAKMNASAARWVHWGSTSQDVIDTGFVLQLRTALGFIETDLSKLISALKVL